MGMAMRDGDRLCAVTLSPAPAHLKRSALVYCHYYLGGGEILAFNRAGSAVSERDQSDPQMFVACEPAGGVARFKGGQVMTQMRGADRSHPKLPPTSEGPQIFARYSCIPEVRTPRS